MPIKKTKSQAQVRRELAVSVLPEVRKLVAKYDLPAVSRAVSTIYEERKAQRELEAAEAKVAALKRTLKK